MIFYSLILLILCMQIPLIVAFPKAPKIADTCYDIGIVLGCPANENGSISQMQKHRMDTAIYLYQAHKISKFIISGAGVKNNYIEAEIMANYAIQKGVKKEDILLEKNALNTYDNLKQSYMICNEHGIQSVVIITSTFHIRRANYFVKKFFKEYAMCRTCDRLRLKQVALEYVRMWNTLRVEYLLIRKKK